MLHCALCLDGSIATPAPLADPPQQDVSPDLPQRDVSPNLPQQDASPNRHNEFIGQIQAHQKYVSHSPHKSQISCRGKCNCEMLWVQNLLQQLDVALPKPPSLFYDNLSATYICKNLVFHSRMKHLALDYFFVHDLVSARSLLVQDIPSKDQIVDMLTKSLGRNVFLNF
ncbi:hypothetical protein V6N12_000322 [Hibiscus sabdariffa]